MLTGKEKETHSYFIWLYGKPPHLVVEVVSNKVGGELERKFETYQRIGVAYYAVHDPLHHLGKRTLRLFRLEAGRYVEYASAHWMPEIGLGLTLWQGTFQEMDDEWLRFVDKDGELIPTAKEAGVKASARADEASARAEEAEKELEILRQRLQNSKTSRNTGLEVPHPLTLFHRRIGTLVVEAPSPFGGHGGGHFVDDLIDGVGLGDGSACASHITDGSEADSHVFNFFIRKRRDGVRNGQESALAVDDLALVTEVERG